MTRVSNSQFKLLEAKYFLKQAQDNQEHYGPFLFNLSACLTAIVSVTYVMQSEFKRKNEGFGKWFEIEIKKMNEAGFGEFKKLRHSIIHTAGNVSDEIDRNRTITSTASEEHLAETRRLMHVADNEQWYWQLKGQNELVFFTCERFISLLEKMVEYCEGNFKWYDEAEDAILDQIPDDYLPDDETLEDKWLENELPENDEVPDEDKT